MKKAETSPQKARAKLLLRAFEYYEATALAYLGDLKAREMVVRSEKDALKALADGVRYTTLAEKRWHLSVVKFPEHPVLFHPLDVSMWVAEELAGEGMGYRPHVAGV